MNADEQRELVSCTGPDVLVSRATSPSTIGPITIDTSIHVDAICGLDDEVMDLVQRAAIMCDGALEFEAPEEAWSVARDAKAQVHAADGDLLGPDAHVESSG